ncbi:MULTISPECIES: BolA family protein [Prochlorococcus]|uniref:BolA-like protein n=1 Tax=Prochlorococcus marinus (strain SARG / CCMP1375 / SS120) TaxID=167539 RepID=Q7VBK6_PROMA|nr:MULTISPECIES: BolA/IbaG family iron-sulfur metabolism protein [Prochlorococcus]AAQ00131.1 BolA-like protein [Prochlorococcus marinus subsp. marinus str. CCMP1375]KGG13927.1 YrbA protein [Prochlorococcus marinus str. LG]KGG19060.1 YrbA protein [Prochlorococcus marinus str. SS2]KGG23400.1 YrbA protein [Prochlorococcus marinus str. SS35]KGG32364.1 YrbA protein [Prochlorococcus marinus str. SS51]
MVHPEEVKALIKSSLPDAMVNVEDINGGGDHLNVNVVSSTFAGLSRVQQHQLIYRALAKELASESIHALALKTSTP